MYSIMHRSGKEVGKRCRYSKNCFACPLADCILPDNRAARVNRLAGERVYFPN